MTRKKQTNIIYEDELMSTCPDCETLLNAVHNQGHIFVHNGGSVHNENPLLAADFHYEEFHHYEEKCAVLL